MMACRYMLAVVTASLVVTTPAQAAGTQSRTARAAARYAMPYARAAAFMRELEVAMTPGADWEQWSTSTNTRWRGCRRLHARRTVRCRYEFTMTTQGLTIYNERGRIDVTRRHAHLVTLEVPPVRIRPPKRGLGW